MRQGEQHCQRRAPPLRPDVVASQEDDPESADDSKSRQRTASESHEVRPIIVALCVLLLCYLCVYPRLLNFMGYYYLRIGQPAAAKLAYQRILRIWPRLMDSNLAVLHAANIFMSRQAYWEARYAEAQAELSSLANALPDRASAHYHLNVEVSSAVYAWESETARPREELLGSAGADNATTLAALGETVRALAAEAEPYLLGALALRSATACEPAVDLERSCHNLGALLLDLGRYDDASMLLAYPHIEPRRPSSHAEPHLALPGLALPGSALPGSAPPGSASSGFSMLRTHRFPHLEAYLPDLLEGRDEFASSHEVGGVLAAASCAGLIAAAEDHAAAHGGWSRGRHQQYPTTDLPLSHLAASTPAVAAATAALHTAVLPAFQRAFPSLGGLGLFVDDAFVAKYGGSGGAQRSLAFHADGTPLSFICTLAAPTAGGGTLFRAAVSIDEVGRIHRGDSTAGHGSSTHGHSGGLTPPEGDCLVFAGGALLHGGLPVTAGVRYLLIGFVGVGRGAAASKGEYDAYRERWSAAKRADAGLHAAHDAGEEEAKLQSSRGRANASAANVFQYVMQASI